MNKRVTFPISKLPDSAGVSKSINLHAKWKRYPLTWSGIVGQRLWNSSLLLNPETALAMILCTNRTAESNRRHSRVYNVLESIAFLWFSMFVKTIDLQRLNLVSCLMILQGRESR